MDEYVCEVVYELIGYLVTIKVANFSKVGNFGEGRGPLANWLISKLAN